MIKSLLSRGVQMGGSLFHFTSPFTYIFPVSHTNDSLLSSSQPLPPTHYVLLLFLSQWLHYQWNSSLSQYWWDLIRFYSLWSENSQVSLLVQRTSLLAQMTPLVLWMPPSTHLLPLSVYYYNPISSISL